MQKRSKVTSDRTSTAVTVPHTSHRRRRIGCEAAYRGQWLGFARDAKYNA